MNDGQLASALPMINELKQQEELKVDFSKPLLEEKISKGIQELDSVEGTDFRQFLNEMQEKFGVGVEIFTDNLGSTKRIE